MEDKRLNRCEEPDLVETNGPAPSPAISHSPTRQDQDLVLKNWDSIKRIMTISSESSMAKLDPLVYSCDVLLVESRMNTLNT